VVLFVELFDKANSHTYTHTPRNKEKCVPRRSTSWGAELSLAHRKHHM